MLQSFPLSPEQVSAILDAMKRGAFVDTAAMAAGLTPGTYRSYRQRAREALKKLDSGEVLTPVEEQFADLECRILRTKAEAENKAVETVTLISRGRFKGKEPRAAGQAAMWLLTRYNPKRFTERQRLEHTGAGGERLVPLDAIATAMLAARKNDRSGTEPPQLMGPAVPDAEIVTDDPDGSDE